MEQEFTIVVKNVNEAPVSSVFKSTGGQLTFPDNQARVNENSNVGVVVGTIQATDKDAGQTLVFSLDDNAGGLFSVSAASLVTCTTVREREREREGGGGAGEGGRQAGRERGWVVSICEQHAWTWRWFPCFSVCFFFSFSVHLCMITHHGIFIQFQATFSWLYILTNICLSPKIVHPDHILLGKCGKLQCAKYLLMGTKMFSLLQTTFRLTPYST